MLKTMTETTQRRIAREVIRDVIRAYGPVTVEEIRHHGFGQVSLTPSAFNEEITTVVNSRQVRVYDIDTNTNVAFWS